MGAYMAIRAVRRAVAATVVGITLAGCGGASTPAGHHPPGAASSASRAVVMDCQGSSPVSKPKSITLACGDGGIAAVIRRWTVWSPEAASGTGTVEINNCQPNCAAGTSSRYPATFRLLGPKQAAQVTYFTELAISFNGRRPGPHQTVDCPLSTPTAEGGCVQRITM
jgi:hypothetical protein